MLMAPLFDWKLLFIWLAALTLLAFRFSASRWFGPPALALWGCAVFRPIDCIIAFTLASCSKSTRWARFYSFVLMSWKPAWSVLDWLKLLSWDILPSSPRPTACKKPSSSALSWISPYYIMQSMARGLRNWYAFFRRACPTLRSRDTNLSFK